MGAKSPTGVQVRSGAIRINFKPKGFEKRVWETLDWEDTSSNVVRAGKLRQEIVDKIKYDAFVYSDYFPDSPYAEDQANKTFLQYAQSWIDKPDHDWGSATKRKYKSLLNLYWVPWLHSLNMRQIKYSKLLDVIKESGLNDLSPSRYNDALTPLRGAFQVAEDDGLHPNENPAVRLKNRKRVQEEPDPFSREEADEIIELATSHYGTTWGCWFEFGFYTGLRCPSEMKGLRWQDVDLRNREVRITRRWTREDGVIDGTKTRVTRTVILNDRAHSALVKMKPFSYLKGEEVFTDGQSEKVRKKVWEFLIKKTEIRHRPMYNMRHTYASMGLLAGADPSWMAGQLGHSLQEFFRSYAKYINKDKNKQQVSLLNDTITWQSLPSDSANSQNSY